MDESKTWISEHLTVVLGISFLSVAIIGALASASLDPKGEEDSGDTITIDIATKITPAIQRDTPRVPQKNIQNTFTIRPHIVEVEIPIQVVTPKRGPKAAKVVTNTYSEVTKTAVFSNRTYTVRPGDTLTRISRKVYGSSRYWKRIAEANLSKIGNYHRLKIGQTLIIPPKDVISTAPSNGILAHIGPQKNTYSRQSTGRSAHKSTRTTKTYTVRKNDTWWQLAGTLLGDPTKWKALKKANAGALTGNVLSAGATLRY